MLTVSLAMMSDMRVTATVNLVFILRFGLLRRWHDSAYLVPTMGRLLVYLPATQGTLCLCPRGCPSNAKYRKAPLLEPTLQKRSSSRTRSSEFLIISEASSTSSGV
jgi:hypothetical protein